MTTSSESQIDIIRDPARMHEYAERAACAGHRIALVPTMGALHDESGLKVSAKSAVDTDSKKVITS